MDEISKRRKMARQQQQEINDRRREKLRPVVLRSAIRRKRLALLQKLRCTSRCGAIGAFAAGTTSMLGMTFWIIPKRPPTCLKSSPHLAVAVLTEFSLCFGRA